MEIKDIIIYGSGGLGRGIVDLIMSINKSVENKWNIIGFIDDQETKKEVNGIKVLGGRDYLMNLKRDIDIVLAFGSPSIKQKTFVHLSSKTNIKYPNLIHP